MNASSRVVLSALPGTVIDVVQRTNIPERLVRLRIWELKRSGTITVIDRKSPPRRGGAWCVYGLAA